MEELIKENKNENELTIILKQHTPLIHFQYDQEGATLRASEVKPKLDRFILGKLGKNEDGLPDYDKGMKCAEEKGWLLGQSGKGKGALNYKMRIESSSLNTGVIVNRFPLFFGNMGETSEEKQFCYSEKPAKVIFHSFDKEVIDLLKSENYLVEFFLLNNFGTRQSKGFGSFYLDESDPLYKSPEKTEILDYRFIVEVLPKGTDLSSLWKPLFDDIELFYKVLRSGLNVCNRNGESIFYIKSIMFKYAKEKGFQWDKKSIKEKYLSHELREQQEEHGDQKIADILHYASRDEEKYLFKDMLGLSSSEDWRSYRKRITKDNPDVERFKSPILFKPIRRKDNSFDVFFKGISVPEKYLDKEFVVKCNNSGNLHLKTFKDFDIDEFLDYAIFEVDLTELLGDEKYVYDFRFKKIKRMFNKIREDYGL